MNIYRYIDIIVQNWVSNFVSDIELIFMFTKFMNKYCHEIIFAINNLTLNQYINIILVKLL